MKWTKCLPCVILFLVLVIAWKTLGGLSGYADSSILSTVTGSAGPLMNTAPTSTLTTPVPSAPIMSGPPSAMPTTPMAASPATPTLASTAAPSMSVPSGVKRVCYDMS